MDREDRGHGPEPRARLDGIYPEPCINIADWRAPETMKRISKDERCRIDTGRRASPVVLLRDVVAVEE
jgi:hypothetical protein